MAGRLAGMSISVWVFGGRVAVWHAVQMGSQLVVIRAVGKFQGLEVVGNILQPICNIIMAMAVTSLEMTTQTKQNMA